MDTEKLYYSDPYQTRFSARVLDCVQLKKGYGVILDKTCFYPEGGGQPGDRGMLNDIPVTDTHERDGQVLHYTAEPVAVGTEVAGEIDWARRFDLMQQHSGEHMVSGVIHRIYGYNNVGFHLGADMVTIDFSGELTEQQLRQVEQEVNGMIWENRQVKCWYPDQETLHNLPYRSKKALTGAVRICEIPGADICACCGTHVRYTGEIGLVKLLSVEKFHGGVRVEMLSGKRAYGYLTAIADQNRLVSQTLSAKVMETARAVNALASELEARKQQIYAMETERFEEKANQLRGQGNVLVQMEGLSADGVRRAAIAIQETCGGRAAVFSGNDIEGYKYAVGLPNGDLRDWVREMNAALRGRGGGKPGFVQGSVAAKWEEIAAFLQEH
ncbi:MAG: alanine--tRNA ligase-related protein [Oscillospiraceae bacterium]|nr:alanine--tRNA ligase-related protein [Oscillospiraceae bacterium]